MGAYTRTKAQKKEGAHATSEKSGTEMDAFKTEESFRHGGKSCMKKGGKMVGKPAGIMSKAHAGRKPRATGGGVFSSAKSGTPRGACPKPY
jgi:hypothetical protein